MALLEIEAIRFAEILDDIDQLSVTDSVGGDPHGYWLVVRDERLDIPFEISSWFGYWSLVGGAIDHLLYPGIMRRKGGQRGRKLSS